MIKAKYDDNKKMYVELVGNNNVILNEFSAIVYKINEVASRTIGKDGAKILLTEAFKSGFKLELTNENTLNFKKDGKNE